MASKADQIADARDRVRQERRWIEEHGRDLGGYVVRYGSVKDPDHSGDGGEAIYEADVAMLRRAEDTLARLEGGA